MTTRALVAGPPRRLLSRLLDSPHLAQLVQHLDPKVLGALVRHCGLEDCGEIVALATTEQLTRIFDDDLWRSDTPGTEEELDADRFGVWLEVLAEVGVDVAARKLVDLDFDLVTAALSRHLLVLDQEMLMNTQAAGDLGIGGDEHWSDPIIERALDSGAGCEVKSDDANLLQEQYRLVVTETGGKSQVLVQDKTGAPDKSSTAEKMLSLLLGQLK